MAEHLTQLCQFLFEEKPSPSDLTPRLRSDDLIKLGLEHFYLILKNGVSPIGDSGKLGLHSWSDSEIQFVASIGHAITFLSRSLSVDQVEPIVVAVVQQFLEFAVCYLEKLEFYGDDLSLQVCMC
ncbi:auxin transport protein BIG-like, partial [Carica papaya]|uniref:auxin transport protein BIG-like n=1 Tax=Carica papaya TaxID=3649 RepID=UPI000B8D099B